MITFVEDSFNITIANFTCNGVKLNSQDVSLSFSQEAGITVAISNISLSCVGGWSFYQVDIHIPYGSGTFNLSANEVSGKLGLTVTADGNAHAVLASDNVSMSIGAVNIDFQGSSWDWLLDLLKSTIQQALQNDLPPAFTDIISLLIKDIFNPALASFPYQIMLPLPRPYDILAMELGLASNPVFNESYIGFALEGDVVPYFNPVPPPITPPMLPTFSSSFANSYIQLYMSSYTASSALYSLYSAALLTWVATPHELPLGLNHTKAYDLIAPGMASDFPDSDVFVYIVADAVPTFSISKTGISATAPLLLGFNVNTSSYGNDTTNAFILLASPSFGINMSISENAQGNLTLYLLIEYVNSSVSVGSTNVGPVNANLLEAFVEVVFDDLLVPMINSLLKNGLPLPQIPGFQLEKASLAVGEGYIVFTTDFGQLSRGRTNINAGQTLLRGEK